MTEAFAIFWNFCRFALIALPPALFAPVANESPLPQKVAEIEHPAIVESSGLSQSRRVPGRYWTHNDSGHDPVLYAMDAEGTSLAGPVWIEGARNVDWESIAIDHQGRIWIGDVGNNRNRRRDLTVYVVGEPGEELPERLPVQRTIRIRYPDQEAFPPEKRNFDCEAIFVWNQKLYLLTKHRSDTDTKLYRLDDTGGEEEQELVLIGHRSNVGMVTGADLADDGRRLAVLTYSGVWIFERPEGSDRFLEGRARHLPFPNWAYLQVEGIAWMDTQRLLISNEQRDLFVLEP